MTTLCSDGIIGALPVNVFFQPVHMPELHLDLDIMERNARRMASEIASLNRMWRPHVKAHRQPQIARKLVELGACGVTAANPSEVEIMAATGIPSVLLAHLVVADEVLDRLAAASRQCEVILTMDHFVHAERLSKAAVRNDVILKAIVDVDIGMGRTGCRPRVDATQLAAAAGQLPNLSVVGIMGYEGHLLRIDDEEQKKQQIFDAMTMLQQTRDSMLESGLSCDIVSAGGSGSFWITGTHEAVTELQAGGGIFGDLFYRKSCGLKDVEPALTVLADVVSRPSLTQAVANCGRKAINPAIQYPEPVGLPGATVTSMSAEHTVLALEGDTRDLKIGDQIRFEVGYSDHSILMHENILVFRGTQQVDVWPVIR